MSVQLFDSIALVRAGRRTPISGSGRRALLALLASRLGHVVTVDEIIDALWGGRPPTSAVKVVQTYVSQLRRLLAPDGSGPSLIVTHPSGYALALDPTDLDVGRFEAAVATAPVADGGEGLRASIELWHGTPYAGLDHPFAVAEADRLGQILFVAQVRALRAEVADGHGDQALAELQALAVEHPLDEAVVELRMRALWGAGRPADALDAYTHLRRALVDELGLEPGEAARNLHARILGQHAQPARPQAGESPGPGPGPRPGARSQHLPTYRTSFVGREREVQALSEMVVHERLTTVIGAGGAGKTRIAVRVAEQAAPGFGGVHWIGLARLRDEDGLDAHCLAELHVTDQVDRVPRETLTAWIGDRHLLLVIDNCEHLAQAAAELVANLLSACPRLHVLATGRSPLHCDDELRWRIPALELPTSVDPEQVATSHAGRLFLERAMRVDPGFTLDADSAPAVASICRRLDGLPLAIELAAARAGSLAVRDLDEALRHRFHLLTSGPATATARHRTLRAAAQWSFDLLSADQKLLLCRLSTFVSDVDVPTILEVCGTEPLDLREVPALLADLVDHSVVEHVGDDLESRYRVLQTVREFGRERLEPDDVVELERRYAEWAATLSERVGDGLFHDTAGWYDRVRRELPHLEAALGSAVQHGESALALRIATGSHWALVNMGMFQRLTSWVRRALDAAADGPPVPSTVMARALLVSAMIASLDRDFDGLDARLDEAVRLFESAGDRKGPLWVAYWRAASLAEMGRLEEASALAADAVARARSSGFSEIEAALLAGRAETLMAAHVRDGASTTESRLRTAASVLERARTVCRDGSMGELLARVELSGALLLALSGDPEEALARCLADLDFWRESAQGHRLVTALVASAHVAEQCARTDLATDLVGEALAMVRTVGWRVPIPAAVEVVLVLAVGRTPEDCARLLGAYEQLEPSHRWQMPFDLEGVMSTLEEKLSPDRLDSLRAEGRELPIEDVLLLAGHVLRPEPGSA